MFSYFTMTRILLLLASPLNEILPPSFPLPALAVVSLFCTSLFACLSLLFSLRLHREQGRRRDADTQIVRLGGELHEHEIRNTRLSVKLESEERLFMEKLNLLQEARDELKLQFENLAGKIFSEKAERFSELNRERIQSILSPFNEKLGELHQQIGNIYNADSRERFALKEEIRQLKELNLHLGKEAENLSRALRSDNKTIGNWGEMVLERLLEIAGLRREIEFTTQGTFRTADGSLIRPDVIIHLPEGREIIIDAKTSLLAWSRCVAATGEEERNTALGELIISLRRHAEGLGKKNYPGATALRSLDFVLMFIPVEAAFAAACSHDPTLMESALRLNVIMISPCTLLTTLRTVQNLWKFEQQGKNAQEIASRASLLYDKFCGFLEEMEKLTRQLDSARSCCDGALNKLARGRGNLISQAEQLRELGVQPSKELPQSIIERAEM